MNLLLAIAAVAGLVFDDGNANGRIEPGERGLPGVVVTDGRTVTRTDAAGRYRLDDVAGRLVFVVLPGDRRATTPWYARPAESVDFGLAARPVAATWSFAHLSDTHVQPENVERTRRALALARERGVDFALVSGDLVKDSLRVGEPRARSLFTLYRDETAKAPFPVHSAMGNHDVFGIERAKSGVAADNPSYGKALFEEFLGPRYHAFNHGGVHFIVLDTIGVADTLYYGFLDPEQLAWIGREIALLPPEMPIVTLCHIPLRNGGISADEFGAETMVVDGVGGLRHLVRNASALTKVLAGHRWSLALQGHFHTAERLRQWDDGAPRYHTAPAIDHPEPEVRSGFFLYTVTGTEIDDGEPVWLD
jgi:hypothetical protein